MLKWSSISCWWSREFKTQGMILKHKKMKLSMWGHECGAVTSTGLEQCDSLAALPLRTCNAVPDLHPWSLSRSGRDGKIKKKVRNTHADAGICTHIPSWWDSRHLAARGRTQNSKRAPCLPPSPEASCHLSKDPNPLRHKNHLTGWRAQKRGARCIMQI